jgi:hypothetical protein
LVVFDAFPELGEFVVENSLLGRGLSVEKKIKGREVSY